MLIETSDLGLSQILEGVLAEALTVQDFGQVRHAERQLQIVVGARLQTVSAADRLPVQQ